MYVYSFLPLIWFQMIFHLTWINLCREEFCKVAGEVIDVRLAADKEGNFKGFGHVEFATAEAASKVKFFIFNALYFF